MFDVEVQYVIAGVIRRYSIGKHNGTTVLYGA